MVLHYGIDDISDSSCEHREQEYAANTYVGVNDKSCVKRLDKL